MNLPILMYHDVEPGASTGYHYGLPLSRLREQLDDLVRRGYETVDFREVLAALEGKARLPRKPVWLTFDDAYASVGQYAVPLLRERGMKGTIFVVADAVGGCNHWDLERGGARLELMDEGMLRAAIAAGMEIGAHGCRHLNLEQCDERSRRDEIFRSRAQLESQFGVNVQVYSYAYGAHDAGVVSLVREAGYAGAVSIFSSAPSVTADRWRMRRIFPHRGDGKWRFRMKLSPLYLRLVALRDRCRRFGGCRPEASAESA